MMSCKVLFKFLVLLLLLPNLYFIEIFAQKNDKINKQIFVDAINKERTKPCKCGRKKTPKVGKVRWNNTLEQAALYHAKYLSKKKKLTHYGPKRSTPGDRMKKFKYAWSSSAENIAYGETLTSESVLEGWMNSPHHCQNIKGKPYTEIGLAEYAHYWVLLLGNPLQ